MRKSGEKAEQKGGRNLDISRPELCNSIWRLPDFGKPVSFQWCWAAFYPGAYGEGEVIQAKPAKRLFQRCFRLGGGGPLNKMMVNGPPGRQTAGKDAPCRLVP